MRSRPRIQYFVEQVDGDWLVRRDGRRYGPYADRAAALREAIRAAHVCGRNDRPAEVLARGEDGAFGTEWTSGLDDAPAAG